MTRYLCPDIGRQGANSKNLADNSARIAAHFTNVFSPWAQPQYTADDRARHLTELIAHAIQTAVWLFGQPDNFRFEWDISVAARQNANRNVVVVPAVWKTTHGGMRLSSKGQNVLSHVVRGF